MLFAVLHRQKQRGALVAFALWSEQNVCSIVRSRDKRIAQILSHELLAGSTRKMNKENEQGK